MRVIAESPFSSSTDSYVFEKQRHAGTGEVPPCNRPITVPNSSPVPTAPMSSADIHIITEPTPVPEVSGIVTSTIDPDDWPRSPGSWDGDVSACGMEQLVEEALGCIEPAISEFEHYDIPENSVDERSYRRSSPDTETVQPTVVPGATIIDPQSLVDTRSANPEPREVLVSPLEIAQSQPLSDATLLFMSDTVINAIAEGISARLSQHANPAVRSQTPVMVDQGSGPNRTRPPFFLPENMNLIGLVGIVTSHIGEPISAVCEHVAGDALESLEDPQKDILRALSTLVAAAIRDTSAVLLRRLQSIRRELSRYDLRDPQQAEQYNRELNTRMDSLFLEICAWDLPQDILSRTWPSP